MNTVNRPKVTVYRIVLETQNPVIYYLLRKTEVEYARK